VTRGVRRRLRQQDARAVTLRAAATGALGVGGQAEELRIARLHIGELTIDQPQRGTGAGAPPPVG
jgi:hypothetical protein